MGLPGTKAAVTSWRTMDSESRIWSRVVESDNAAFGTANDVSFVAACKEATFE